MTDGAPEAACQLEPSTSFLADLTAEASCELSDEQRGTGLVLEVFAGTCRFSKACRDVGLRSLAIDKDPKRSENFPVANFDLTRPHDYDTVCKLVEAEQNHLVAAHFAPSCGTASRAREKLVPGVANPPRPLRSESYPDGLPSLADKEQQRVDEANASYSAMVQLIPFLVTLGIAVSIENPLNMQSILVDKFCLAPVQTLRQQLKVHETVGKRNIFTMQARGNKLKPLVTEWGSESKIIAPVLANIDVSILKQFPKGSKILQRHLQWGFNRDDWRSRDITLAEGLVDVGHFEILTIGVPREPMQFIRDAIEAEHPKNAFARVSPLMRDVLHEVFLEDPVQVRTKRTAFLKKWMKRAVELKPEEQELHNALPSHLKKILAKKKLLLWREILIDLEYPDHKVIDEAIVGFPMTGWSARTGVFETCVRPPENSLSQLQGMAKGLNMAVVTSLQNSEWQPIDETAWAETLAEVERGWLGVEDSPDLDTQHVAKRFPIVQKGKTRLIDDFSVNGINSAYGMGEKLRIDSIDEVMACLSILLDGDHAGRKPSGVLGRTFDLKAAYKQFGVDSEHAQKLRIAIKRPGGLTLPWTSFFDDFTMLTPTGTESDAEFFAEGLFKLLGLEYAAEGTKAPPFSDEFRTLGLLVKTSGFLQGSVELGHTPERREELLELLTALQKLETVTVKQLEQLHGRIVWFRSFVFGKAQLSNKSSFVVCQAPNKNSAAGQETSWSIERLGKTSEDEHQCSDFA
eukprot:s231_g22.t1